MTWECCSSYKVLEFAGSLGGRTSLESAFHIWSVCHIFEAWA